jgi:hypothetical protein
MVLRKRSTGIKIKRNTTYSQNTEITNKLNFKYSTFKMILGEQSTISRGQIMEIRDCLVRRIFFRFNDLVFHAFYLRFGFICLYFN